MRPLRVLHVITSTDVGGAEMMLLKLLSAFDRAKFSSEVLCLKGLGPVGEKIRELGVPVTVLDLPGWRGALSAGKILASVRGSRPDLIQGWMSHGNLMASLLGALLPGARVVWNIRQTLHLGSEKFLTGLFIRGAALLSGKADCILYNSHAGRRQHEEIGYEKAKGLVVPNGFDLSRFAPDPRARARLLGAMGLASHDGPLVGIVGRYHAMKDYPTFLNAAGILAKSNQNVKFVMIGNGLDGENAELRGLIGACGLDGTVHLLGRRGDVHALLGGLDIFTLSSSSGEGFPNVLGEAMACGVSCVATRIGDSEEILGDTGMAVPPSDPPAMARAWEILLATGAERLRERGARARDRILAGYSLGEITLHYARLYTRLTAAESDGGHVHGD